MALKKRNRMFKDNVLLEITKTRRPTQPKSFFNQKKKVEERETYTYSMIINYSKKKEEYVFHTSIISICACACVNLFFFLANKHFCSYICELYISGALKKRNHKKGQKLAFRSSEI